MTSHISLIYRRQGLPQIIFHEKPPAEGGQNEAREGEFYAVQSDGNDTAYNNEELMVKIINEELLHLTSTSAGKLLPLVMDYAAFHTPRFSRY